jgi:hypothetical protein
VSESWKPLFATLTCLATVGGAILGYWLSGFTLSAIFATISFSVFQFKVVREEVLGLVVQLVLKVLSKILTSW